MNNKLIIHNETDLPDDEVLLHILKVINDGKVSETKQGRQYCFITTFKSGIIITSTRKGNTYTFKIYKEETK